MLDFTSAFVAPIARHRRGNAVTRGLKRALLWPLRVMEARRTWMALASLDSRELRDIGLSSADLFAVSGSPLDEDPGRKLSTLVASRRVGG